MACKHPRIFVSSYGSTILVGRCDKQNDELTQGACKGDLWFHVHKHPGAHVLLRPVNGYANAQDIMEAAEYAGFYSKAPNKYQTKVEYCDAQNVRKVPGSPHGQVMVSKTKLIKINIKRGDIRFS